jgi:hypothetical protein
MDSRSLPPTVIAMASSKILSAYRATFVAIIIALSVQTMTYAKQFSDHHFWLAAIEIAACLLFLIRRTQIAGLALLLAVFSGAAIHDIVTGHIPFSLVLFGATAVTIVLLDRAIR